MHGGARIGGGKQPIGGEGNQAEARARALEGARENAAVIGREVEIIHGARDVEIRVRVEALDEAHPLVAQIAFDLEIGVEREGRRLAVLQVAAEFAVQRLFGQVGDMGRHARHAEPLARPRALLDIAPAAPIGIGHDGLPAHLVKGDVLSRMLAAVAIGKAQKTRSG